MQEELKEQNAEPVCTKKALSWEALIFLILFTAAFGGIGMKMGLVNMLNTLMNTAYALLIETVLYIMAVTVLAGALSALLTEFGVVSALNKLLSPLMKPLYGLPGASIVGVLSTYLSDNPAILTLAEDRNFLRYFRKYQVPALTNIGTAFGMGLIISTFMIGAGFSMGQSCFTAVLFGNIGAIAGNIVSTRLMLYFTGKILGRDALAIEFDPNSAGALADDRREVRPGRAAGRFLSAALEGGKTGVEMGLAIIPGVLIICTLVMMLSNGPGAGGVYTGAAYEGVGLLPWLGAHLDFILKPLFGFSSPEAIAVPITALGSAGAAIGLVPKLLSQGLADVRDIAVFTAMCMCWSGYLSTHVAMMDSLHYRQLTGKAIACHTIGGLVAGITAHLLCYFL